MSDDLEREAPPAGQPGDAADPWGRETDPTSCSECDDGRDLWLTGESCPSCGREQPEREKRPSRLLTAKQLQDLPKPVWTVEQLVPEWGVGQLFGPPASGKTFVALDLALTLSNTDPDEDATWHGHAVNGGGDVVYALMEGAFDFQQRLDAWLTAHPGLTGDNFYALVEEDLNLGSSASVRLLHEDVTTLDVKPRLLVVDTQALATAGVDENSNKEMGLVMAHAKWLARELRCFVLLVHHTGWKATTRSRGASAQLAALDLAMGVDADTIVVSKVKAAPMPDPMRFTLEPSGESVWAKSTDAQDQTRIKLLRLFIDAGDDGHTVDELVPLLGASKTTVQRYVERLLNDAMVEKQPGSAAGGGRGRAPDRYVWSYRLQFLSGFMS